VLMYISGLARGTARAFVYYRSASHVPFTRGGSLTIKIEIDLLNSK
jgi:hypothetical protein